MLPHILFCILIVVSHSGSSWADRSIYQVVTDRFAIGQSLGILNGTRNNTNLGCSYGDYNGGNWKGIQDKLSYIKGMGFDAIWISPIPENTDCGYHGYWAYDLNSLNPHFGSDSDLKELVSAAHVQGMWVMVDIVANHMGPVSDLNSYPFFSGNDFHSRCSINYDDQNSIENCWLANLPDLKSDSSYVQSQLNDWLKSIMTEYNFDGIRVDTVPYVPKTFWRDIMAYADISYAIGEVLVGGKPTSYIVDYTNYLTSVLHYPLYWGIKNAFIEEGSFWDLHNTLADINKNFPEDKLDILGTFVDNHDNPRFLYQNGNWDRLRNALAFIYGHRGIPIVYYGTEQGMTNGGSDDANRAPLWNNGGYNTNSDLYKLLSTLNSLRSRGAFAGTETELWCDNNYYCFKRTSGLTETIIVVVNKDNVDVACGNLPAWAQNTALTDELSGQTIQTTDKISVRTTVPLIFTNQ